MAVKFLNGVDVVGSMNIVASDVPNLDASKITSGTIAAARMPDISGTYLTTSAKAADSNLLDGIDSSSFLRSDASDVYDGRTLSFGTAGNGTNTSGAFLTVEGNTDSSGEGSGRLFFREHNSTTAAADNYGVSMGYRGGSTAVNSAMGNSWTGLSQVGNGQWGMWGHDNNAEGALIMHGDRAGTYVDFSGNNIQGISNAIISGSSNGGKIYSDDFGLKVGTNSGYIQFGPANGTWAHIYTDRPNFYFNKNLYVNNSKLATESYAGSAADASAAVVNLRIDEEVIPAIPTVPTTVSSFTNDSNYIAIGSTVASSASWANATKFASAGDIATTTAGNHSLQVYSDINNDAFMAFHISSDHAVYFGLENSSNRLYTGGWSVGAAKYQIFDTRDFSAADVGLGITAHGWGDHASAGYAQGSFLPLAGGTATGTIAAPSFDATTEVTVGPWAIRHNTGTGRLEFVLS